MAHVDTVHPDCRWEDIHKNGTVCDIPALDFFSWKEGAPAHLAILSFVIIMLGLHRLYSREHHTGLGAEYQSVQWWFEYLFINPCVPLHLENFVAYLTSGWFLGTITMAITRYYHKQWAVELLSQQGPFNLLSWLLGGGTIGATAHVYTYENTNQGIPDGKPHGILTLIRKSIRKLKERNVELVDVTDPDREQNHFKSLDLFFSLHLFCGMIWLIVGGLQIFWAKSWSVSLFRIKRERTLFTTTIPRKGIISSHTKHYFSRCRKP